MTTSPLGPVRTCVGCRSRGARGDLLRVVLLDGALAVDERGHLAGRGARLHPNPTCLDLAERRRALSRALRVPEPVDVTPIRRWLADHGPSNASG